MKEIQQREEAMRQEQRVMAERQMSLQEAKTPMADPSKNPALAQQLQGPPQGA